MPIKVIVVDDSFFMRKVISDALNSDPDIKVIDTAKDGIECLEKAVRLNPDVITLDIDMPIMDGLTALKHLTKEHPTPVIMLSALTREGADETFKALQYGAADFVPKPSGMLDFDTVKEELINKVKNISKVDLKKSLPKYIPSSIIEVPRKIKSKIIIIGASTGGPPAIEDILSRIPKLQVSIFIVQHMHPNFTRYFAERLNRKCIMGV
ncbi:MAG: response regulator, partial [Methanosarcinales archaeon]